MADTVEKVGLAAMRQKFLAIQCVQQFWAEGVHRRWLGLRVKPLLSQRIHQR
jgi:hypothetical protein